jgi:hypothetical protein
MTLSYEIEHFNPYKSDWSKIQFVQGNPRCGMCLFVVDCPRAQKNSTKALTSDALCQLEGQFPKRKVSAPDIGRAISHPVGPLDTHNGEKAVRLFRTTQNFLHRLSSTLRGWKA